MEISTTKKSIKEIDEPLVIVGLMEPVKDDSLYKNVQEIIEEVVDLGDFKGEKNELLFVYTNGKIPSKRLLLVGLGKEDQVTIESIRQAIGNASRKARDKDVKKVAISVDHFVRKGFDPKEISEAIVQGMKMGSFQNIKYKTKNLDKFKKLEEILLFSPTIDEKVIKA